MNSIASGKKKRVLSVFSIVMINIIAIDSLRNVPAAAEYGSSLVFYYAVAALCFFIPSALISAELATGWPKNGGIYIWVREAFGPRWGLFAIWLQWIENVIWYPTIMSFVAGTLLYAFDPELANDRALLLPVIITLFWLATLLNLYGMRLSAIVSTFTALIGTLVPMVFIIILGGVWLMQGHASQISFAPHEFIPNLTSLDNLSFLIGVLLSLVGMELSASHAQDVKNPQRDYPKAALISVILIVFTLVLSSLAIAMVIPQHDIQLVSGLVQAYSVFFNAYHMPWMTQVISIVIIIGGLGGVAAWIIGPSKGLLIAAQDNDLPKAMQQVNKHDTPRNLLLLQGFIFTALCSVFLLIPSINGSYWILTTLTTQLYMLMYVLMFAAAVWLRYKHPDVKRSYKVPGGNWGIWLVASSGTILAVGAILIGFLPPPGIDVGNRTRYELILLVGFIFLSVPPYVFHIIQKMRGIKHVV
jgi:putative glutamate/gamma-aminobutyrate antiporter